MDNEVPIRSVSRFIALFREINLKGPLSLGQMVNATGIPYPTTSRIVQTMLGHGLIERIAGTKSYCVAAMALSLSHGFQRANRLAATGRPMIEALTERIGWPLAIMTRVGTSMVARASTHHLTTLSFGACPAGSAIPILHSASGHVFLAYATREERAGILDGLERFESRSPMLSMFLDGRPLDRICAERCATYERNRFTDNPGKTSSISVPVLLKEELQGTLTLVFFSSAMPMDEALHRYLGELEGTALEIEEALLHSSPQTMAATDKARALRNATKRRGYRTEPPGPRSAAVPGDFVIASRSEGVAQRAAAPAVAQRG